MQPPRWPYGTGVSSDIELPRTINNGEGDFGSLHPDTMGGENNEDQTTFHGCRIRSGASQEEAWAKPIRFLETLGCDPIGRFPVRIGEEYPETDSVAPGDCVWKVGGEVVGGVETEEGRGIGTGIGLQRVVRAFLMADR